MRRLFPIVALFLAANVAVTAPVPKDESPEKKLERLFGKPHQPDGTKVALDGNRLKVSIPDGWREKNKQRGNFEYPHTERIASGDFELTVAVTVAPPKDATASAWVGAYIRFGEDRYFDYKRRCLATNGSRVYGVVADFVDGSWRGYAQNIDGDQPTATIRLTRRGNDFSADIKSRTGEWIHPVKFTAKETAAAVRVGIHVFGSDGPVTAEFEDFKVTPLK